MSMNKKQLEARVAELEDELKAARAGGGAAGEDHEAVRGLKARVAELEDQLKAAREAAEASGTPGAALPFENRTCCLVPPEKPMQVAGVTYPVGEPVAIVTLPAATPATWLGHALLNGRLAEKK